MLFLISPSKGPRTRKGVGWRRRERTEGEDGETNSPPFSPKKTENGEKALSAKKATFPFPLSHFCPKTFSPFSLFYFFFSFPRVGNRPKSQFSSSSFASNFFFTKEGNCRHFSSALLCTFSLGGQNVCVHILPYVQTDSRGRERSHIPSSSPSPPLISQRLHLQRQSSLHYRPSSHLIVPKLGHTHTHVHIPEKNNAQCPWIY